MVSLFDTILASPSPAALHANIRSVVHGLGFESFHYGSNETGRSAGSADFLFDGIDPAAPTMLSDLPAAWFVRYQEQQYGKVDPIVRHCTRSMIPAVWHLQQKPALQKARNLVRDARAHGMAAGATFSLFGAKGQIALMALTTSRAARTERRNIERQLGDGCMLLAHVYEATRTLARRAAPAAAKPLLTARERECLQWVSAGKTSWETARILAIAERTVNFHIDNVNRKLGTHCRVQTVARALSLGLVNP